MNGWNLTEVQRKQLKAFILESRGLANVAVMESVYELRLLTRHASGIPGPTFRGVYFHTLYKIVRKNIRWNQ